MQHVTGDGILKLYQPGTLSTNVRFFCTLSTGPIPTLCVVLVTSVISQVMQTRRPALGTIVLLGESQGSDDLASETSQYCQGGSEWEEGWRLTLKSRSLLDTYNSHLTSGSKWVGTSYYLIAWFSDQSITFQAGGGHGWTQTPGPPSAEEVQQWGARRGTKTGADNGEEVARLQGLHHPQGEQSEKNIFQILNLSGRQLIVRC